MANKKRVLITGIGGGGVGLQIFKALQLTDNYEIFGADASNLSIGLYLDGFKNTFILPLAQNENYIEKLLSLVKKEKINIVSPGSEAELKVIARNIKKLRRENVLATINNPETINLCSDKLKLFTFLKKNRMKFHQKQLMKTTPKDIKCIILY